MKDLDEVKGKMQVKHIGVGKSSEKFNRIPSALSAFTRVTPTDERSRNLDHSMFSLRILNVVQSSTARLQHTTFSTECVVTLY